VIGASEYFSLSFEQVNEISEAVVVAFFRDSLLKKFRVFLFELEDELDFVVFVVDVVFFHGTLLKGL